jgi:hypothetical protein
VDTKVLTPNNGFQRVTHCAAAEANVSDSTVRSAIHRGRSLANSLWQFRVVPGLSRARWQASASRVFRPPLTRTAGGGFGRIAVGHASRRDRLFTTQSGQPRSPRERPL